MTAAHEPEQLSEEEAERLIQVVRDLISGRRDLLAELRELDLPVPEPESREFQEAAEVVQAAGGAAGASDFELAALLVAVERWVRAATAVVREHQEEARDAGGE